MLSQHTNITSNQETKKEKGDLIIAEAIKAHGGKLYDKADYSFVFRGRKYRFKNNEAAFEYSVEDTTKAKVIKDVLSNESFLRYVSGKQVELSNLQKIKSKQALNSVIYFATLPNKLKDGAVNKKFIETTKSKGETYDVIEVTFDQKGGGEDHEDQFYYWVNQKTHKIDYLAYNYKVNGGGIRFRSVFNRTIVDGIVFQDYINWKAPKDTPLKDLIKLHEKRALKEVSRIILEQIENRFIDY